MASEVKQKPKGILKASSSFDKPDHQHPHSKEMKWDEMNILATHHPADKDYGHMKIDEPKTPYSKLSDAEDDEEGGRRHSVSEEPGVDPKSIASRLQTVEDRNKLHAKVSEEESSSEEEEDEMETEEMRAQRRVFEQKRKLHYNEFQAVKLAKQLMEEEEEIDEEDENDEEEVQDSDKKKDSIQEQDKTVDKVQNQDKTQADSSAKNT
ncbi:protein phosphatase inhibitor 2-like [Mytilus californianus]|uniref:protein phosphatase inhibitor 2-like n=1 Tax=Mytilus californianus TaxID=6549 RepID=UPI002245A0B3|nr:protein phosphatase inhibitor 2-like [Mytilus californianus]